jgi:twitching motility protein PilI
MNSSAREQKYQSASYLRLHLTATTQGVIPTNQLQEVVIIESDRLTPIPNMPPWIMGLLNQRSRKQRLSKEPLINFFEES